ncbi:efflux RND transporter periplasmic adaptor subunit [Oscillospiraceae bacterium OttesenSCG-928-F05]|nr:efflux RND transporter periplasmic adaptor subunit [Oscillospiraceae bacterium OttesenSCG-928-F05]
MKKIAALLCVTGAVCACLFQLSRLQTEEVFQITAVSPALSDLYDTVSASGRVEEIARHSLFAGENAVVERILVSPGSAVKANQVLMELKPMESGSSGDFGGGFDYDAVLAATGGAVSEEVLEEVAALLPKSAPPPSGGGASTQIISPIDGVVTDLQAKEGENVSPLSRCAIVSDTSRMQARVTVGEADIKRLEVGMPVVVSADTSPAAYNGVVLQIVPMVKQTQGLTGSSASYVEVIAEIFEPDAALLVGSHVTAQIRTSHRPSALTVPYDALLQDENNREFVYVIENGRAVKRLVSTGLELSSACEITGGLTVSDRVILSPGGELYDGAPVSEEAA